MSKKSLKRVKLVLTSPSGSVEHKYVELEETPGGYVRIPQSIDWLFNHGDKVEFVFLDQLEPDERTAEDERMIAAQ